MGLGRTTRFARLPPGARRISVMRAGAAGLKALAPSERLLEALTDRRKALMRGGMDREEARAEAFRLSGYRARFRREILSDPAAVRALHGVISESKVGDVYLMCMCPYRTRDGACHTYVLLKLARELDPSIHLLPEPLPNQSAAPTRRRPSGHPATRRGGPGDRPAGR